jgi:nicotinate-nucleotide adenylyltransferase
LEELRKMYGADSVFYFILGADAILEIDTWKNMEKLPTLCRFIVVSRPGYKSIVDERFAESTHLLEIPEIAISSTTIRKRIKEGKSVKYLLPERVESYIYENKLYGAR